MIKKLFTPASPSKWQNNVSVGGDLWASGYARGYYEAAETLAVFAIEGGFVGKFREFRSNPTDYRIGPTPFESAQSSLLSTTGTNANEPIVGVDKNSVSFPICFNYRHFAELTLKHLIIDTEYLYFALEELKQTNGILSKSVSARQHIGNEHGLKRLLRWLLVWLKLAESKSAKPEIEDEHSLERLLRWLVERLKLVKYDQPFDPDVYDTIIQLHQIDPDGQTFRYPFRRSRTTKKLTLPIEREYDLETVRKSMKGVNSYLSGIGVWLDYRIDEAVQLLSEEQQKHLDAKSDWY